MRIAHAICLVAALGVASLAATTVNAAQAKTQGAQVSESFVIQAIDQTARLVTLKDDSGELETIYCGPEVERFSALKVGDKVTFRYYESMVYALRKAGSAAAAAPAGSGGVVRSPGNKPGGTMSQQITATVTLTAIDPKVPSVGIATKDGQKMSFKVDSAKDLEGVKVGDLVEITYTQALAISVTPGK